MPSVRSEEVKRCPFCDAVWAIEDNNICHKCHKGFQENGFEDLHILDFSFTR